MSFATHAPSESVRVERISWARAAMLFLMMKGQAGPFNKMLAAAGYTVIADDALDLVPVVNMITALDTWLLIPFGFFALFRITKIRNENYRRVTIIG